MGKLELQRILNKLRSARDASNWQGKFTQDIRIATMTFRQTQIADPIDVAITALQKELDKRDRKTKYKRNIQPRPYRAPYIED